MIILDTHVLIFWLSNPEKLSRKAREIIEKAVKNKEVYVSSISVWEIAMLVSKGRLELAMEVKDWIAAVESLSFLHFVPVNNNISIKSVQLKDFIHKDPVDRIIIATSITLNALLITKDDKILKYPQVKAVW
ncbi:MAG: type II toxin-antitoxin system VapC family toxin [bacterium]